MATEEILEIDDDISNEETESSSCTAKSGKSDIHQHFKWSEDKKKFKCNYCKKYYKEDHKSTGNLWKHARKAHKSIIEASSAETLTRGEKITDHFGQKTPQGFSQTEFESKLLDMVILTDQAFCITEAPAFKDFANYGRPVQNLWSATTLKRKLVQLYEQEKEAIIQKLKDAPGKISLILDCWSSKNGIAFNGIIASWINKNWEYEEILLDLVVLRGRHTGAMLAASLLMVLENFEISNKISAITTDNASNNVTMMKELQDLLAKKSIEFNPNGQHVRCLAHIVNLACKDAMAVLKKISEVEIGAAVEHGSELQRDEQNSEPEEDSTDANQFDSGDDDFDEDEGIGCSRMSIYQRVRASIQRIRRSVHLREAFSTACKVKKVKHKQLVLDNSVRWNTGYFMLNRVLKMREPYQFLTITEKPLFGFQLQESEWELISEIVEFLEPFYKMTLDMSKAKVPSMALSAAIYIHLYNHLESYEVGCGKRQEIIDAAEAACDKLNKYYPESDGIVYIMGILLDPRSKQDWYRSVNIDSDTIKKDKSAALRLWDEKYKPRGESTEQTEVAGDILMSQLRKRKRLSKQDEFRQYLSLPQVDEVPNNDILLWWKEHQNSYPALSAMARDYLAASGTSIPIERVFSYGPDLLSPKRMSMVGETIRKCFCLKAWRKSKLADFAENKKFAIAKAMAGSR